jgi:Beta-propeller repeat
MQLKIHIPLLLLAACACLAAADSNPVRALDTAPLRFEPAGPESANNPATFVARGTRFRFEFTPHQAILRSGKKDVRLRFDGASPAAQMQGTQLMRSTTNLYLGNDPRKWRQAIPNFGRLEVHGLYRGIDLTYYGNGGQLEYDLTVKPDADPQRIRLRLEGTDARLSSQGDLVSPLIQKHPVAYQIDATGARRSVESSYRKNGDGSYGFRLGAYDRSRALVIDPEVLVAQYVAGSYQDVAVSLGHDSNGLVYVGGNTFSPDLPLVGSSYQTTLAGLENVFLAVVNPGLPASSQVIYVTYIGGDETDILNAMAVDSSGDVYMTGTTTSGSFPQVNAAQPTIGGTSGAADAFVLWMSPTQTLKYSTFFGGSGAESGQAIAVGSNGLIWVGGNTQSTDLPNTGGFQSSLIGAQNMFVAAFNPSLTGAATEVHSIYIGGTHWDEAYAIAVSPAGGVWLAGGTYSSDIWIQGSATEGFPYQGVYGGDGDAYIAHVDPALGAGALLYASFLGGSNIDEATSLVLDPSGNVILSGYTLSSNFPVSSNAFQTKYGGDTDAFVTVLNTVKGQLVYSTYFGGDGPDASMDLKEDSSGVLYLCGYTESAGLPSTSDALQAAYDGSVDAFALKLNPANPGAAGIDYFTYLGTPGIQVAYGVDFDTKGDIYMAGYSSYAILAGLGGPERATLAGNQDAFVVGFEAGSIVPSNSTNAAAGARKHLPWRVSPHR